MTKLLRPFLIFGFLVTCILADAADSLSVSRLTIQQGLSNNSVLAIYQDHQGFMWFGTFDGLNRYDGYEFKIFRNDISDTASLPHNYVTAIGEDNRDNIWIGTGQGVSIYNSLTGKFTPGQFVPDGRDEKIRIPFSINVITGDSKGNLFIGTSGGGFLVKPPGTDIARQLPCIKTPQGECRNGLQCIAVDKKDNVWLFVADLGLCRYDAHRNQVDVVDMTLKQARAMEADPAGNLWIGTDQGLWKFSPAASKMEIVPLKTRSKIIGSLDVDRLGKLWIGEAGGVDIYDPATGQVSPVLPLENRDALSGEGVVTVYEDRESRKWIGTLKGGIDIIDPQPKSFQTITHDPLRSNSLVSNFVSAFYEDGAQNLWIGTDGGGISVWNRAQDSYKTYRHIPGDPASLSNNSVPCFQEDYLGNLWVATFGGGVNRFDKASGKFEHFACIDPKTGEVQQNIWLVKEDNNRNLWAAAYGAGKLYLLNPAASRFEVFNGDPVDIYALTEDKAGELWAGTTYGLLKVNRQNHNFEGYPINKPVRAVIETRSGDLWLGTEGLGLLRFDRAQGKVVESFSRVNGLCNNSVLNILEDATGKLWLSTFHGLAAFDPAKKTFRDFYQEDGLQSNQFAYNAALRLQSGELAFGGVGGFNLFDPGKIQSRNYTAPLAITGLRINNRPAAEGNFVSEIQDGKIKKLTIPFSEAVLSVDFAALEYSAPGKISYAYYLEGWDKGWNYSGALKTASYTKLNEGNYTLHIKATNAEGAWNPKEIQLEINVLPPWYRSGWAYLLYTLAAASLLYLFIAYRNRQNRLQYEVKLAHMEMEKEKEMNEKKLSFFTDVSHEFRTPLTLIINPLKDFLHSSDPQQDKQELNIVYKNARRLLLLVDQLLQFRKAGADADTLHLSRLNFTALCRDVYASFANQAKSKNINYQFVAPDEPLELYADREKLEVILFNLLSNALKFTPVDGEIIMTLAEKEDTTELRLADNGQGIPPEVGNKLFERFYRVEAGKSASKPGFGIGLYLVKHFVSRHYGDITYDSQRGLGTTFCVSFKKGRKHFNGLPVYEDLVEKTTLPEAAQLPVVEPVKNGLEDLVTNQNAMLVVEDNDQIREYIKSIFKDTFTVYEASGGNKGIDLAKTYLPDVIITDIMMDEGNGMELCSAIKNDPALGHIPVILLTAISDTDVKLKGTEIGADDYITKPFEKDLLVARVAALLKSRTKLQQYFYNEVTLKQQDLKITPEYKEFLDNCIRIVEGHLDDDRFTIKTFSQEIGMSHSALYRKVKSVSGQSIAGFIRFIRLRKAAELMINTNYNINEIASMVGMNDIKYFRRQFNALFGMNPSDYIKKFRQTFTPTLRVNDNTGSPGN